MHPTAGAVAIGARAPLVAFNAYLGPATALPATREIAVAIRESSGGLPGVRALAFEVNGQAQLSMNLVDLERMGLWEAYDLITREAAARGLELTRTEIVGLVPERALWQAGGSAMRLTSFDAAHVLEHRLRETATAADLESLLDRVAAPISAPGGGSVAAYAGALAASLAAMVGGIAARRGLGGSAASEEAVSALRSAADKLLWLADDDSEAYTRYMEARQAKRDTDPPLLEAARVPLRIARKAANVAAAAADLAQAGLPAAAADAATAALLADAVCAAAALTVRVNIAGLSVPGQGAALLVEAEKLTTASRSHAERAAGAALPAPA
jgi:formiminotetrahydrofolate cyclodeaminase